MRCACAPTRSLRIRRTVLTGMGGRSGRIEYPIVKDKRGMAEDKTNGDRPNRTRDEVALEMMKFIAVTTGYGKGTGAAGFTGKTTKTPEEYAEALIQLFQRCRSAVDVE